MLAVNSAKGPHVHRDDFAAQVGEAQGRVGVEPHLVDEFGRGSQIGQGGSIHGRSRLEVR